jgi:YbgC/YbaW family acyl-CoA thioester hydrolase
MVYPDDCDAFGHVNHSSFVRLLERARWEAIAAGPAISVFAPGRVWPAVRRSNIDFYAAADAGHAILVETALTHSGKTSFTLHQTARREDDRSVLAEADFLFVCLGNDGTPVTVPDELGRFFGTRPSIRSGAMQHVPVNGLSMAVDVEGDGPAVLFVHGFPLDRTMWRHLVAGLSGWTRIAPDLRGMGLTDVPRSGYSMARYADDLAELLNVLSVDRAVVCGLSMGGYITFELMRRHSDRISGLILVNTRAAADAADARKGRDEMIELIEREGPAALPPKLVPKLFGPSSLEAMPRVVEHVRTMIIETPQAGIVGALSAMRDREDSTSMLPNIGVPTLVISGGDDQIVPANETREWSAIIPNARLLEIPEAGHLTPLEQPIAVLREIREFLAKIG